ncbi:MAG: hypothetical protein JNN27_09055 [Planctomycetes bacterium]|nr:hypothetical protein [Planctomycetota bacterium]
MTYLTDEDSERYAMLNALDAKCAGLLQISSIFLVVLYLKEFRDAAAKLGWPAQPTEMLDLLSLALMGSIALQFFVLWFSKKPDNTLVAARIWTFHVAWALAWFVVLSCLIIFIGARILAP